MRSNAKRNFVCWAVAAAVLAPRLAVAAAPEPPRVLLWGSKNVADLPADAVGKVWRDPALAPVTGGHTFTYAPRGEGKLKGVDVFRDLTYKSASQPSRRIYEGYVIGASWMQLASGRVLVTFHAADPDRVRQAEGGRRPEKGIFDVRVMYSDDDGATWNLSADRLMAPAAPEGTNYGAVEPGMFPLRDGRVWMLIRTQTGRLYESYSSDGGRTWTAAAATRFISSDSPAERVRLPDGGIVLFLNGCQHWDDPHGYAHGGRQVLHAAVSHDEGKTWRGFREVARARRSDYARGDHGTAYPRAVATEDGAVVVGTGQAKENVVLLRVDPGWLGTRAGGDDFAGGLDAWHVTARGARLATVDGGNGLEVGSGPAGELAEAVWNFPAGRSGTLTLRITAGERVGDTVIGLTDHFSPPGDEKAIDHGLCAVRLSEVGGGLRPGQTATVGLAWDAEAGRYELAVDGRSVPMPALRRETLGASYLRVRSGGGAGAAVLVRSVAVDVGQ